VGVTILYTFCVLSESLPPSRRTPFEADWSQLDPRKSIKVFTSSAVTKWVLVVLMCCNFGSSGLQNIGTGYAIFKFGGGDSGSSGGGADKVAKINLVSSVTVIFVNLFALPVSLRYLDERHAIAMFAFVGAAGAVLQSFAPTLNVFLVGAAISVMMIATFGVCMCTTRL
jgi:hypothetical protein